MSRALTITCRRCLCLSSRTLMPYKPEERPPLDPRQKRLYPQVEQKFTDEGYPVLKFKPRKPIYDISKKEPGRRRRYDRRSMKLHRPEETMSDDQDWTVVWPTAKTFMPGSVPLALRQSWEDPGKPSIEKYANTELIKVCNFLHLTPKAIEMHCNAIKKFCTEWPETGLETDEEIREHFPVTHITRDYVQAGASIRNVKARIVELKIKLEDLKLTNKNDIDKLKMLARMRYDEKSDMLTIVASACPTRVQNKDYAEYLLRALYFESIHHEDWETEKPAPSPEFKSVESLDEYRQIVEKKLGLFMSEESSAK